MAAAGLLPTAYPGPTPDRRLAITPLRRPALVPRYQFAETRGSELARRLADPLVPSLPLVDGQMQRPTQHGPVGSSASNISASKPGPVLGDKQEVLV